MSLVDQTPQFVQISLLLKCIFLIIIIVELMLPRLKPHELKIKWKTDWSSELQNSVVEGSAFLFSIGLLLVFDLIASGDSWLPLPLTIALDILLVILVLYLLFSPKLYGITETGLFQQGIILKWEHILDIDHTQKRMKVKTKGSFRENRIFPLPGDESQRKVILERILKKIETARQDQDETT